MKKLWYWVIIALVVTSNVYSLSKTNAIYQVSTIDALMQGVYDSDTSIKTLLDNGDFGVGTFQALDGEMVILDGKCYQIKSDGKVNPAFSNATTPFACVTSFKPDFKTNFINSLNYKELELIIEKLLPTKNIFNN